jgi:polysaccharide pyruvyl transferase WcaK-like protein
VGLIGYYGWSRGAKDGEQIYQDYIAKITQFVQELLARGYRINLLTGEIGTDDRAVRDVLKELRAAAPEVSAANVTAPTIDSVQAVFVAIAQTDIVVASRYHNIVVALVQSKPAIAVGYARKFNAVMEPMGLAEYCQEIESLDVARLLKQFDALIANYNEALAKLKAAQAACRREVTELYDALFGRASDS